MLKIVKELLEKGSISKEVADVIEGEWKSHTKVLNEENKSLREAKDELSRNYEEVLKSKSDLDSQMEQLEDRIKKAKEEGKKELAKDLEAERESKIELQKSLANLQKANTDLKLDNIVSKTFKNFDVKDEHRDTTEFYLRSKVTIDEEGNPVFKNGDEVLSVEDGFKSYFEANEKKLNPVGNGGGGAGNHGGSGEHVPANLGGDTKQRISAIQEMINKGA